MVEDGEDGAGGGGYAGAAALSDEGVALGEKIAGEKSWSGIGEGACPKEGPKPASGGEFLIAVGYGSRRRYDVVERGCLGGRIFIQGGHVHRARASGARGGIRITLHLPIPSPARIFPGKRSKRPLLCHV